MTSSLLKKKIKRNSGNSTATDIHSWRDIFQNYLDKKKETNGRPQATHTDMRPTCKRIDFSWKLKVFFFFSFFEDYLMGNHQRRNCRGNFCAISAFEVVCTENGEKPFYFQWVRENCYLEKDRRDEIMVRCVGSNVVGNHLLNQSRGLRMTDEKKTLQQLTVGLVSAST